MHTLREILVQFTHLRLGEHPRIKLIDPLDYESLIHVLKRSYLILTDSGGMVFT